MSISSVFIFCGKKINHWVGGVWGQPKDDIGIYVEGERLFGNL